jgi:ABC-type phosphate transport system substrate-binding protein
MTRSIIRSLVLAACLMVGGRALQAQAFTVVVNAANPATSLTKSQASELFLKKSSKWSHGATVAPVDQRKASPVRETFSKAVHGRAASAIGSFWQQQIFAGKDVPPPEKGSDADVLAFVRTHPGAIGYVATGTELGAGVKAVAVR